VTTLTTGEVDASSRIVVPHNTIEGRFMKRYAQWLGTILSQYETSANSIERGLVA